MKIAKLLLILLLATSGAYAQTPAVERIDVVEYGIYTADATGKDANPNVPGGTITHRTNVKHALTTREIPAQKGVEFGFFFNVVGSPGDGQVPLHVVALFPKPGLRDPSKKEPFMEASYDRTDRIGARSYLSYTFEDDWELVPGVWTLQLWYQGRKMVEQKFTVKK